MRKNIFSLVWLFLIYFNISAQSPQIGSQVWIEPGQSDQQIDYWFKTLSEMNMPVARIFMQWNYMQSDSNTWDFSLYDKVFRSAEKHKVKVIATLMPNNPPAFYGEENWFRIYNAQIIKNNHDLAIAAHYIDVVVNRYKSSSSLDSWILMNEPGQEPTPDSLAIERFRLWLKNKYGEIKILNEKWISHYTSFDSIVYHRAWLEGGWTWHYCTIDWHTFWREHMTWSMKWIVDEIKKHDTQHTLHVNPHGLFGNLAIYNLPEWSKMIGSLGASVHPSWHFYLHQRNKYAEGVAFINDLMRGAASDKPYWITELQGGNNIYSGAMPFCPTATELSQWLWTSVGSGAERIIFWTLNARMQGNEAAEWSLLNLENKVGERMQVASQIASLLKENQNFFINAKPVSASITILLSPETMILEKRIKAPNSKEGTNKDAHMKAALAYYKAFQDMGIRVNIKFIDEYHWNENKQKQLIILPHMFSLTEQQIKKIDAFVFNGNKVIATGLTGLFNEYNQSWIVNRSFPLKNVFGAEIKDIRHVADSFDIAVNYYQLSLPAHLWETELSVNTARVIGMNGSRDIAVKNRYGKGEAVWIPSPVDMGAWMYGGSDFRTLIKNESEGFATLPISFVDPTNDVFVRILENKGKFLSVFVNQQNKDLSVAIQTNLNLTPRVIFGNEYAWISTTKSLSLKAGETLVMMWE